MRKSIEDDGISPETRIRNRKAIERMMLSGAPFAGMIRYFDALSPIPEG